MSGWFKTDLEAWVHVDKGIRSCYTGLAILNHDIGEALLHVVRGSLKGGE